jgi:nucleotide-binding universal stress UspA family protein
MLQLKRILVAIDFSPISIVALRHALGIARRYQSNVSLLHVIDPSIYGLAGPDGISADTETARRDSERIEADLRRDGSLEGLKFGFTVNVGPVWSKIADAIEEKRSALLVLGTPGRTGLRKLALGSVAERAFREASCPVLTVGPKVLQSKPCGAEAKHFLVPTDLSLESISALPYGTSLAKATEGDATLLHVRDSRPQSNNQDAESVDEANARLREFPRTHPEAQAVAQFVVKAGSPAEVVIAFAKDHRMDLIVMGRRAWAEDSPPMWRTAYAIVTQAPCPVLSITDPSAFRRGLGSKSAPQSCNPRSRIPQFP